MDKKENAYQEWLKMLSNVLEHDNDSDWLTLYRKIEIKLKIYVRSYSIPIWMKDETIKNCLSYLTRHTTIENIKLFLLEEGAQEGLKHLDNYVRKTLKNEIARFISFFKKHETIDAELIETPTFVNEVDLAIDLEEIFQEMSELEREVARLRFIQRMTLEEISTRLKISVPSVYRLSLSGLEKLHDYFFSE